MQIAEWQQNCHSAIFIISPQLPQAVYFIFTENGAEMSKHKRIIFAVLAVLFMSFAFGMLLEFLRAALPAQEFTSRMEEAGYVVEERVSSFEGVDVHLVADCDAFYVEFIVHESAEYARRTFRRIRSDLRELELLWDIVVSTWSSSYFNSWYEQVTSDGLYARMARIGNTIIFVSTVAENSPHVADIWELLGK